MLQNPNILLQNGALAFERRPESLLAIGVAALKQYFGAGEASATKPTSGAAQADLQGETLMRMGAGEVDPSDEVRKQEALDKARKQAELAKQEIARQKAGGSNGHKK